MGGGASTRSKRVFKHTMSGKQQILASNWVLFSLLIGQWRTDDEAPCSHVFNISFFSGTPVLLIVYVFCVFITVVIFICDMFVNKLLLLLLLFLNLF